MRAFVQRCEVRLSTIHRVATALLSGAGILVLLPAVERDTVISVLRSLLHGALTLDRLLLTATVAMTVVCVLVLLWMVLLQLTRFYFHASHIRRDGTENYTPRFTLTSLRLPLDELGEASTIEYEQLRSAQHNLELLVPANTNARDRIDRQLAAYPALAPATAAVRSDADRAEALLELAAARRRTLLDEVVKVEYGMARHMLRLQVVILRYVKALLVVVVTVLANYIAAAAVDDPLGLRSVDQRWIAATMVMWAPIIMLVVASPVRWLESLLRAEGADRSTVRDDPEFTQAENVTSYIAVTVWLLAAVVLVRLQFADGITPQAAIASGLTLATSTALLAFALIRWLRPPGTTVRS